MSLLSRLRGEGKQNGNHATASASLGRDARAMEAALTALELDWVTVTGETAEPDLRAFVRDLLEGEIAAPTADVRWLVAQDTVPAEFYAKEIAPNWDGLDREERAGKLDRFVDLAQMVDADPDALPREMAATVRTKTIILAWAFDEVHGYTGRLARQDSD
jgi:hypothetical protein